MHRTPPKITQPINPFSHPAAFRTGAVRAAGPPGEGAAQVEEILAATEAGIAQIEADPEALADGPPSELKRAGRLSRRFGAEVCGLR
jgi:hypothetical protein